MQSTEFTIDGVLYLLSSSCEQVIWPKLCDRVQKELIRIGKEVSQDIKFTAVVAGTTKMCNREISFYLTTYPKGNSFV